MAKCLQFDTRARSNRKGRRKANALAKQTKIVMEGSLATMPKFILEVKDGVILLFNEHVPYPDGWYWHTNPGPFIGPFESIDDASGGCRHRVRSWGRDQDIRYQRPDREITTRSSWRSGAEASERSNAQSRAQPGAR